MKKKRRTVAHVVTDLKEWIRRECPSALPAEAKLAQMMKTSRPTLRVALAMLAEEGLLEKVPSRGYFFKNEAQDYLSALGELPADRTGQLTIGFPIWAKSWAEFDFYESAYAAMLMRLLHQQLKTSAHRLLPMPCGLADAPNYQAWQTLAENCDAFISYAPDQPVDLRNFLGEKFEKTILLDYEQGIQENRVSPDFFRGYDLAFEKLYLGGARRILAVIGDEEGLPPQFIRVLGIDNALARHPDTTVKFMGSGRISFENAYAVVVGEIRSKRPFDGILCHNDGAALGVMRACRDYQLKVPDDVQVVGFGNFPLTRYFAPQLSTIDCHWEELTREAIRAALALAGGSVRSVPSQDLPVSWVEGTTTRNPAEAAPAGRSSRQAASPKSRPVAVPLAAS